LLSWQGWVGIGVIVAVIIGVPGIILTYLTLAHDAKWYPFSNSQSIANPTQLTEFETAIEKYYRAEKAALQTLDPNVVAQLPVFAHGEALDDIRRRVEMLRVQGLYQELIVQQQDVQPEVLQDGEIVGVLAQEKHTVRTYQLTPDGDRLVDEKVFDGKIVYGLIHRGSRWKVDRVRPVESTRQTKQ
jgi:hypothetical protein